MLREVEEITQIEDNKGVDLKSLRNRALVDTLPRPGTAKRPHGTAGRSVRLIGVPLKRFASQLTSGTQGQVLRLALPAVGEQILNMTVGLANTYMVGHHGSTALTAVGLSDNVVMLVSSFFTAVATGSTALVARAVGARDEERANQVLRHSMLLALLIGLLCTVIAVPLVKQTLVWLQAGPDVLPLGISYLSIVSFSYLMMSLMFVGNGALRGAGDTRTPLWVMGIVNVLNILITYLLLDGQGPFPALGVRGPAIGATIGRTVGSLIIISMLLRGRSGLKMHLGRFWQIDSRLIGRILDIGLPAGGEAVLMRFGQVAFAAIVSSLGTVAYAAHSITMTSLSMSFMPGFGFGVAATTLMGQRLGAKDPEGADRSCHIAWRMATLFMATVGALMFLFAPQVVGIFIEEPDVISLGTTCLRILGLLQPATATMLVFSGALRGAGDTRWPMFISAASIWLVRVPLGRWMALTLSWGLPGVWIAAGVDMASRALLFWLRYRTGGWRRIRV